MAAGMAHEINNPLAHIQSNIEFVQRALTEPLLNGEAVKELEPALQEALEGTQRIGRTPPAAATCPDDLSASA